MTCTIARSPAAGSFANDPAGTLPTSHADADDALGFDELLDARTGTTDDEDDFADGRALRTLVNDAFAPVGLTLPLPADTPAANGSAGDDLAGTPASADTEQVLRAFAARQAVTPASASSGAQTADSATLASEVAKAVADGAATDGPATALSSATASQGQTTAAGDTDTRRLRLVGGDKALADAALRARLSDLANEAARSMNADAPGAHKELSASSNSTEVPADRALPGTGVPFDNAGTLRDQAASKIASGQTAAVAAAIDAFHLSRNTDPGTPQDSGARQQSAATEGDGSALTARIVPGLTSTANFDATLGAAQSAERAAAIPNEAGVAGSIVQSMRMQLRDGIGTAVVNLEPNYLGAVTVALRVDGGAVTATLHAENPQVRAWMEANEPLLRQGLSDQGLTLDRLIVSDEQYTNERSRSDGRQQQPQDEGRPRPRSRRSDTNTFEVVV